MNNAGPGLAAYLTDPIRRNVVLLALCQALSMSTLIMAIATTALASNAMLGPDKALATLPVSLQMVATMAATIPASLLMRRIGRRWGFTLGAWFGFAAGIVGVAAIQRLDFELMIVASMLHGVFAAFALYYRFAAADAADDGFRPVAISLVLAGGVLAALIGPMLATSTVDLFAPATFAGVYATIAALSLLSIVIVQFIRIPTPTAEERRDSGRPLTAIMRQPDFLVAAGAAMVGYGAMSLIMTATPLAMLACGFGYGESTAVIQWHVLAMFAPSFFTGKLINRFGVRRIILVGLLLEAGCVAVNLTGVDISQFTIGLILLGLGWNFTFIGGTTLVTSTYQPKERAKVQAVNDFLVFGTTAAASLLSGALLDTLGWSAVNLAIMPFLLLTGVAVIWTGLRARAPVAAE